MRALASVLEESTDVSKKAAAVCDRHAALVEWLGPRDTVISFNYDCVMDHALRRVGQGKWSAKYGSGFPAPGNVIGHENWSADDAPSSLGRPHLSPQAARFLELAAAGGVVWLGHRLSSLHDEHDSKVFDKVVVHRPPRARPAAAGRQLPVRARPRRRGAHRREQSAARRDPGRRGGPNRHHDAAEVPARHQARRVAAAPHLRRDRGRGALIPDRRVRYRVEGRARREGRRVRSRRAAGPAEDAWAAAVAARGRQPNLAFFAFTATPKARTLELFGRYDPTTERHAPFHLYSMRQAIEEGFILDVLANYVTYQTYWHIEQATPEDPEFDPARARAAIARFVSQPLSRIIARLNERFGTDFAPEDRVFYDAVFDKLTKRPDIQQAAAVNTPENFRLVLEKEAMTGVLDQLGVAEEMALAYVDNPDMQAEVLATYAPFMQGRATVLRQEHCDIIDLLGPDRESTHLEYKATLRTHADSGETFKPLETSSLKTIAAFMNSREGGTLLIGVADNGTVHGLDSDYASRSKTEQDPRDRFPQHLANVIAAAMGDAAATLVRPQIHQVNGGEVCRVQVDPAGFPVDAKAIIQKPGGPKDTRTEFYVRVANGTKALDVVGREKYLVQRWSSSAV